jgi:hypothetical protein
LRESRSEAEPSKNCCATACRCSQPSQSACSSPPAHRSGNPPATRGCHPGKGRGASARPGSHRYFVQSAHRPVVTFEKVTVTFFVTFFSCVFPRENPEKPQMLLCYLFWKGIPGRCTPALNLIRPSLPSRPSVGLPSFRAYPRLTAPIRGKPRLIAANRAQKFSGVPAPATAVAQLRLQAMRNTLQPLAPTCPYLRDLHQLAQKKFL